MLLPARSPLAASFALVLACVGVFAAVRLVSPSHPLDDLTRFLPLHSFLEAVSIVVAALVFGVVWNSDSRERPGGVVLLACALLAVALIDFAHALSYPGMPEFVTPAGTEKSIFFWLAARGVLACALFAAALAPSRPLASPATRHALLAAAIGTALIAYWVGLFHLDSLPHTFIEGVGLTGVKVGAEAVIIALLAMAAWLFYRRARHGSRFDALLFTAAAISAIGELHFTHYKTVADADSLFGHLLKVAGYAFIYAAVFVSSVREPFAAVLDRERKLMQAERIAQVGSWQVDLQADRMILSDEALRIHGLTRSQFDSTLTSAILLAHPDDRARLTTAINDTLYNGKPFSIDYRIVRPDGSERFVRAEDEVVRDASGNPVRAFGIIQDITERKHRERELQRFRLAMDVSIDSIYLTDPVAMRFVDVNSEACRRIGYTREQLLGMGPQDVLEKDAAKIEREYQQVFDAGDKGVMTETRYQMKSGEWRWTELYRRAFETEGGRLMVTVGRDITDRKKGDEALRRFRAAMDASGDGFVLIDRKSMRYVDCNQTVCEMTGYARAELLGMTPMEVFEVSREVLEHDYDDIIADRSSKATRAEGWYRRKDGVRVPIETRRRAVQTVDGWVIVGTARDITDRREAEEKIARLNRLYAVLSGINSSIVRIRDRAELFAAACGILVEAGKLELAYIFSVNRATQRLEIAASAGVGAGLFLERARVRLSLRDDEPGGYGPAARAVRGRQPVVINDVADDPEMRDRTAHLDRRIGSIAAFPLYLAGEPVAALTMYANEAGFFDEQQLRLLDELAGDIGFALDHIEKATRLDHLAYYDQLTGLANRRLFVERLAQTLISAGQAGDKLALLLVDLERLATVNESLGRQAGDALTTQLAQRLTQAAGTSEVARVSANHFAVLFRTIKGRSEVLRRSERLWQQCFGEPFRVSGQELRASARGGIALFPVNTDAETLLLSAEMALRRAKETGERLVFHAAEMRAKSAQRLSLENQLRLALERREFILHYQPKVDMVMNRIVGVEALMRWQSPELGLVPPLKFIPLMEETGMILEAGAWAIARAAEDHKRWIKMGIAAPRVAVNVSAVQLRQNDYLDRLAEALAQGAVPTGVDLEITESVVMGDIQGNILKLKDARALGVDIAIDDFGTGYSSLGYLARLPVQSLKIDRSFIVSMLGNPDTLTLVRTIISLAHSLRLKVVAEGVDSEEQAQTLRMLRCDEMQGYLFSKPLPFEDISRLLAARS